MTKRQPFGEGMNKSGREIVSKMESEKKTEVAFSNAIKKKMAQRGVNQEWMKKHVIITKI
jgi:hypothetical protein